VLKGLSKAENRVQLQRKNPRAFEDFCRRFMLHSAQGCANITRRVQGRRVSLFSMERALRALKVPSLVIVGDEDPGAIESGLFMKQVSPAVRLSIVPATGHLVNLEEPDLMHRLTEDFFALVESRQWRPRGK
jgi:3-oxoadipate enol-lactonase